MTRRALALHSAGWLTAAALCALALVLASCGPREPDLSIYGTLDAETWREVADALPLMPASPWPCVSIIYLGEACAGTEGCYWPDDLIIQSKPAALVHELWHSALYCATGDPDNAHTLPVWREVP